MTHRKGSAASKSNQQTGEASTEGNIEDSAGASAEVNASSFEPALRAAISEITTNISRVIDEKLGPLSQLLQVHREELDSHEKRITETETRISAIEDAVEPVKNKLGALEKLAADLSQRAEDLENRGRRKNIRIVGLPEGAEGDDPTRFFETWLPGMLNIDTKAGRLKLERAHRSLAPAPPATQRPRSVLVRFHNFQDKQRVMNASWEMGKRNQPLKHGNATVMIFQDFSAAVLRKRKRFDDVKKRLKSIGADYRQVYPASLKVTHRGSTKVFQDPASVERFIESLDVAPADEV